ncbi:hypothetical protein BOTCAL_0244g00130 [Botryotinia calthae]|uniref:Uncharacterized protein n=1 Tax=Botryotinia calthae TaxID=38488 RepID=A0A4Y8CZ68_9HELO|nr:hypothetical protein BOTCAL_0244g00130 [Botryotinia calthae]
MTAEDFARQVVSGVLTESAIGRGEHLWKGTNAFVVWLLSSIGWRKIFNGTVKSAVGFDKEGTQTAIYDKCQRNFSVWSDPKIALNKPYYGTGMIMKHRKTKRIVEAHQEYLKNEWWNPSTEALMLLEKYADSFARVPSRRWSVQFRKYDPASLKDFLPRAKLIKNIKEAYKYREYNDFVQGFKEAVDDMDGQLVEIRKASQRLFEYGNDEETERVIRMDYRKFKAINWNVN